MYRKTMNSISSHVRINKSELLYIRAHLTCGNGKDLRVLSLVCYDTFFGSWCDIAIHTSDGYAIFRVWKLHEKWKINKRFYIDGIVVRCWVKMGQHKVTLQCWHCNYVTHPCILVFTYLRWYLTFQFAYWKARGHIIIWKLNFWNFGLRIPKVHMTTFGVYAIHQRLSIFVLWVHECKTITL